jgi:hypothetical protein
MVLFFWKSFCVLLSFYIFCFECHSPNQTEQILSSTSPIIEPILFEPDRSQTRGSCNCHLGEECCEDCCLNGTCCLSVCCGNGEACLSGKCTDSCHLLSAQCLEICQNNMQFSCQLQNSTFITECNCTTDDPSILLISLQFFMSIPSLFYQSLSHFRTHYLLTFLFVTIIFGMVYRYLYLREQRRRQNEFELTQNDIDLVELDSTTHQITQENEEEIGEVCENENESERV